MLDNADVLLLVDVKSGIEVRGMFVVDIGCVLQELDVGSANVDSVSDAGSTIEVDVVNVSDASCVWTVDVTNAVGILLVDVKSVFNVGNVLLVDVGRFLQADARSVLEVMDVEIAFEKEVRHVSDARRVLLVVGSVFLMDNSSLLLMEVGSALLVDTVGSALLVDVVESVSLVDVV